MARSRVTIRDVALAAGVSHQTVSRVINGSERVNPDTRARVETAIEDLGYRPHAIARFMARGRTRTLAFIAPNLSDYTFARIIEGAEAESRKLGYLIFSASASDTDAFSDLITQLVDSGRTDGMLIMNPYQDDRHQRTPSQFPIVYVGAKSRQAGYYSVSLDDEKGGYDATKHLLDLGHINIVCITGPTMEDCTNDRTAGYQRALQENGVQINTSLIKTGDWSASTGYAMVRDLLSEGVEFSAIFAQNDRMAAGAAQALREAGLHIPDDVSVIGFDDMPLASYFHPPLTTMRQDLFHIGQEAAKVLIHVIDKQVQPDFHHLLPAELVQRNSSGRVKVG